MSLWILVVILVAAATVVWVLAPLFRTDAAEAERVAVALSEVEDLYSQREMALGALKDLEDDRATGKIGDADYADLKDRYSRRAVEILRRLDELEARDSALASSRGELRAVPSSDAG
jgi:cytochrome c-type biogenesis protein CcmI